MYRLSLHLRRTPAELAQVLTLGELVGYQALVELDGPWWLEGTAAYLRQLSSVIAASVGAQIPDERFTIEWEIGGQESPRVNLLPAADGLAILAGRLGAELVEG